MTRQPHAASKSDLNLLFGILALQMDFIDREQLIRAMQAWLYDKTKSLGAILVEQNVLSTPRLILLQALVEEHLKQHQNDPQQSLAAVGPLLADGGRLKNDLEKLADNDVHVTLVNMPDRGGGDPYATSAVGTSTSEGLRFRILRPHARGGLGTVYVAHDEELHREVALKEIQDHHAHNENSRARFLLEAEITGRLEHPGIVPVYGLGQYADGRPYYAMRFIKGDSLQDAIARFHDHEHPGRDPQERNLEMRGMLGRLIDVCDAIQYAHDRGVLHRDLKPGNIMLGKYGETLVVDWGLAKPMDSHEPTSEESSLKPRSLGDSSETLQGSAVGTPAFMSPEQAGGKIDQLGPASDVYSLGATLYCLLTGKAPIDTSAALESGKLDLGTILRKVQHGDFPRPRQLKPDVDRALEAICLRAMALKPADRYRSPRTLANDLEHWLADRPVAAWPEPWSVRARRWIAGHRTLVASAAVAVLFIFAGLVGINLALRSANDQLARSNREVREARDVAEEKQHDEQKAREQAVDARTRAEQAQAETAETLALNTIVLAQTRWNEGQVEMANDLLDDVPTRARSHGWRFLKRRFEGSYATLYGHLSPVNAATFDPQGRLLASGGVDRTLQLWDAVTGERLWTGRGHQSGLTSVAFSPDSALIASGSWDGTVKIWDVQQRREVRTFLGHSQGTPKDVSRVAFSPDGQRIASASDDGTVKVWDPHTGNEFLTLTGHMGPVRGVAFSPDGKTIASCGDDTTVKLWDAGKEGPPRQTLTGHGDKVWQVAFSPDSRLLASASDDDSVKVWRIGSNKEPLTLEHRNDVRGVAFSPDGQYLASSGYDRTINLWDAATGELCRTLFGHTAAVLGIGFTPDGQRLASASADKTIKLWDVRISQDRFRPELLSLNGHAKAVTCASLSRDGRQLAAGSEDQTVKVWDVREGKVALVLKEHTAPVRGVAFSRNGERLASCGDDGSVRMWHGRTGATLWSTSHAKKVRCLAFSPDGKLLASAGDDQLIKLWNAESGKELRTLTGHTGEVWSVAFSPGGQQIASASSDKTVKIWEVRGGPEIHTLRGHLHVVSSLAYSPEGDRLISGSYDQTVRLWDPLKGRDIGTIDADAKAVLSVAFSPDGYRLASAGRTGTVRVWDAAARIELAAFTGHMKAVQSVSFSSDGEWLISAGDDHTCKLWDVHVSSSVEGAGVKVIKANKGGIRSVDFSHDGQHLATAGWDGTIKMWQAGTGEELLASKFKAHKEKVVCVQFSPAGDILAAGDEDRNIKLFNTQTGEEIRTLTGHDGCVNCIVFSKPDGRKLASGGADGQVRVWETATGRSLPTLTGHTGEVRSLSFSFDGTRLASASYDRTVKIWDMEASRELHTFGKHRDWVTSVSFNPQATRVVSRDLSEVILVWDPKTLKELHRSRAPDPMPFPANFVDKGNKLVLTTPRGIQIVDMARTPTLMPGGGELAYRQNMSRPKHWWHEDLGVEFEKENNPVAAGFHWSWAVIAAPTDADTWLHLDRVCRRQKSWHHAQTACVHLLKQQPKPDIRFPAQCPWLELVLAAAHRQLGNDAAARECLKRAVLPGDSSDEQRDTLEQVRRLMAGM